jgi:hypothetical protein
MQSAATTAAPLSKGTGSCTALDLRRAIRAIDFDFEPKIMGFPVSHTIMLTARIEQQLHSIPLLYVSAVTFGAIDEEHSLELPTAYITAHHERC